MDAKASCCVLRSLASIKYTFRRCADLGTPWFAFLGDGNEHTEAYEIGRLLLAPSAKNWSDITLNSCRFEQSFSPNSGKTWKVNWVATDTRIKGESDGMR